MKILLSNDDGIHSPGIQQLFSDLKAAKHDVWLVAPASDRSTVGHSLTLHKPLRINDHSNNQFSITGSPADCVYVATRFLLKEKPDVIISGINKGANLGHDIFYSGTVAAAREGALFGTRSLAVSLVLGAEPISQIHWSSASHWALKVLPKIVAAKQPARSVVFNLNVPNLPMSQIQGIRQSRQGVRVYSDSVTERLDPRGKKYYWVGGTYQRFEEIAGTDCDDVHHGYASLVPLRTDTTFDEIKIELEE